MDFKVFEQIIGILHREAFKGVYLYMSGEPIYHPRFMDCIDLTVSLGMVPFIATKLPVNLNVPRLAEIAMKSKARIVFDITVDAIDQKKQTLIAPGIRTAVVKGNLAQLNRLAKTNKRIVLRPITVVTRHNEGDLAALKTYFKSLGLSWCAKAMGYYMGSKITPAATTAIASLMPLDKRWRSRVSLEKGEVKSMVKYCRFHEPGISVDGDVTICCHDMLFEVKTRNIIREGSLLKILESPEYQQVRQLGNERNLPICRGCN